MLLFTIKLSFRRLPQIHSNVPIRFVGVDGVKLSFAGPGLQDLPNRILTARMHSKQGPSQGSVGRLPHPGGGNVAKAFAAHLSQHLWEKHYAPCEVDLWDGCSLCSKEGDYLQFFNCLVSPAGHR